MTEHGIKESSVAGNSPDLIPIENLWAIVKKRLREVTIAL
jgi:hypothetical protein